MHELLNAFCFFDPAALSGAAADADRYASIVGWAGRARGTNPNAFDAMTDLLLDDAAWTPEALPASAAAFSDLLGLFRGQTARLRECLRALEPSGLVNAAVFPALDRLESALNGDLPDLALKDAVARACADPAALRDRRVRELLAGGRTGPAGTASVDYFGYLNLLKDCDAGVQWTLFMPDVVRRQQDGFRVSHFSYKKMPAMRFVGFEGDVDDETRAARMQTLAAMTEYRSGFDHDVFFMHHYGCGVDVGPWHGFLGRFLKAGAPVPEGFVGFDFIPERSGGAGLPYLSQFAYAEFEGDDEALHRCEGFDSDAMYDVTRNIMLGQGVCIPYPDKYWTAEVFLDGCGKPSRAYLFSAAL